MDMQNVKNLTIPDGGVKTIHDKDSRLLWGAVGYNTTYRGDTFQQTYTGKNLFDKVSATSGQAAYVLNADGTITTLKYNNLDGRKYFNNLSLAAGTYTLSYVPSTTNTQKNIRFSLRRTVLGEDIVNTSFTYNDNVKQSYTFTLETDVTDLGICIEKNNSGGDATVPLVLKDIQLEAGNQATSYEPFTGSSSTQMVPSPNPDYPQAIQVVTGTQTVTISDGVNSHDYTVNLGSIELAKIGTYEDYIYKSGDDWYVHKAINKLVANGTENWISSDVTRKNLPTPDAVLGSSSNNPIISDRYIHRFTSDNNSVFLSGSDRWISVIDAAHGYTLEAWKAWLAENNTTFYYALATATDTQITDSTLIGQLNAIHERLTRYGYNSTVSGNLPLLIEQTNLS